MTASFCGDCGTPSVRADQRFCLSCGASLEDAAPAHAHPTPYDAAPTPTPTPTPAPAWGQPTAYPAAPTGPAWGQPTAHPAAPTAPLPEYAVPATAPKGGGPRLAKVLGIGALVLALGGAGFVGWQVLGPKGGSGSPEEAVQGFVDAVMKQDGVGLLDVIAPGEVQGVDDVYQAAQDRLEKEGLTNGSSITDAVSIELTGLEFEVEELGEHAARVTLADGDYEITYDPSKLSDRLDFVADQAPDVETDSGDLAEALQVYDNDRDDYVDFGMTTVEIDGRWYVTLIGTYADLLVTESYDEELRSPDFDVLDEELEPITGEDPEAVIDNLVEAINDRDVDRALANLPEGLVVGLRPYSRSIDGLLRDNDVSVSTSVDNLDLQEEDLGDGLLKVTIDGGDFHGEVSSYDDSAYGDLSVSDGCFYVSGTETDYDGYSDTDDGQGCIDDVDVLADLGIEDPYVVLREVDGGYQLDPVATVVVYATTAIEEIPSSLIDDLLADIEDEVSYQYEDDCSEYDC